MKKIIFVSFMFFCNHAFAQKLQFDKSSLVIREGKEKVTETINFSIKTDKDSVKVTIVDNNKMSAEKGKDYEIEGLGDVWLCNKNDHKGKIKIIALPDEFEEEIEDGKIEFSFKISPDEKKPTDQEFNFSISNSKDGSADAPVYTQSEIGKIKGISYEMYTGGNFDFFDALKINKVGGEIILDANSISHDRYRRWGFTTGIFNFNTLTYDSSNGKVTTRNINTDKTFQLREDTSLIIRKTIINHNRVSSNLWGYYFNPTYRINQIYSDFFNWYVAFEAELLRVNTKGENDEELYKKDSIIYKANKFTGAVFMTDDPIPVKNYSRTTNGYFGIGVPIYLNASDKVRFFFQPSVGFATHGYYLRQYDKSGSLIFDGYRRDVQSYFHCKFRASEQYTGLRITIGGEIRKIKNTEPLINLYLGLKVDLAKWFKK